ncbi:MAG: SoxR reducing system RseC family protein [Desulfobacterales bacterium]|nr:SoxR reducing system RseC family protein [Desulfobacterales bacterium]
MAQLLTKTAIVKAVQGDMALVVTKYERQCAGCKAKDTCSHLGGTGANVEVKVRNTACAQVGDIVTISIQGSYVLKASFIVYMVPVLALTGGVILGHLLTRLTAVNENILVGAAAGIAVFGSFLWLKQKGEKLSERQEFIPDIISKQTPKKIIHPEDLSCPVH